LCFIHQQSIPTEKDLRTLGLIFTYNKAFYATLAVHKETSSGCECIFLPAKYNKMGFLKTRIENTYFKSVSLALFN